MKNGQWKDWTEPLEVLLANVKEFLAQINFSDFPQGEKSIGPPELYTRKEVLAKAFVAYMDDMLIGDFLANYIYVSDVYRDAMAIVFEYIGENEHQMDLQGDEFAQTKDGLLKDFALYIENW